MIRKAIITCFVCLALVTTANTFAGDREKARRIHDRLVGTPPSPACLTQLQAEVAANNEVDAALDAITNDGASDECTGQDFYRVTLKNFITPWTNEEQTVFAPLNDYTATVIGIIRDDYDFRRILYDNIIYTGDGSISAAYAVNNNTHYEEMSTTNADLQAILVEKNQTDTDTLNLPTNAPAGIMTTRQGARAYFIDGTNRAMFRFTLLNHLCTDLEQIKDTSRPPDRIRQDVSRSPGGDSRIFMNACVGCHSGMDPMAQAFSYYNYNYAADEESGVLEFTDGTVQPKYHINANNFEYGYVTPDNHWDNYWRSGPNSNLGWSWSDDTGPITTTGSGTGAASLGQELANSYAFAQCQVEKVFKTVCLRSPIDAADRDKISGTGGLIEHFKSSGFNLKQVFAESAVYCMGD